jgi:hypothetical protein
MNICPRCGKELITDPVTKCPDAIVNKSGQNFIPIFCHGDDIQEIKHNEARTATGGISEETEKFGRTIR